MVEKYDVVILGGGPAALCTAITLRQLSNYSVLVTDSGLPVRERPGETAPPDLLQPLRRLNLDQVFLAGGHATCPGTAVRWGRDQVGYNDHILNPMGPGWRLNRREFDNMLLKAAEAHGVTVCWETHYTGMTKITGNKYRYQLDFTAIKNKRKVCLLASWVVDATGPLARFATDQGIKKQVDDQLFALLFYRDIDSGNMTMQTFLEATEEGWWYAARLPEQRLVNIFATDASTLRKLKADNFAGWDSALNGSHLIGPSIASLKLSKPVYYSFPIYSSCLEKMAGDHWLAVGDAASCYDPVASQGIYKALTDAVKAGQAIVFALDNQPGKMAEYEETVKANYQQYLINRNYLYGLEQRWSNASFWKKRQGIDG